MLRIQSMPSAGGPGSGGQQQQQPSAAPSPGMQPEQYHNAHMQPAAGPYGHISSGQPVQMSYRHAYEGQGHAGAPGAHANAYAQQNAARYGAMGPQAHQMHGHGDGYYPNMMYNDQRGNMCAPSIQHCPHFSAMHPTRVSGSESRLMQSSEPHPVCECCECLAILSE